MPLQMQIIDENGDVVETFGSAGASSGAYTDHSGTITAGGTAQNAMAANSSRHYAYLKNPDAATEPLYYSWTGTASASSPDVLYPGDVEESNGFVSNQALSVYAATTGHAWIAREA